MKYVGLGLTWRDIEIGDEFRTIGRTVSETDIVNFISCTGMLEVLFTDMEYLKEHGPMQGRVAPGALVYAFAEGLLVQSIMQHTGLAFLNMELNVHGPTFAGDTIHVECEVVELKPTSKDRALVRTDNRIVNQKGECVISYNPLRMVAGSTAEKLSPRSR